MIKTKSTDMTKWNARQYTINCSYGRDEQSACEPACHSNQRTAIMCSTANILWIKYSLTTGVFFCILHIIQKICMLINVMRLRLNLCTSNSQLCAKFVVRL